MKVVVEIEAPDNPDVIDLLRMSDTYMANLYPSESNHLLDVDELKKPNTTLFVARQSEQALGCGCLVIHSVEYAEVKRMYVDESGRGKGIGKLLLETIIEQAKKLEVSLLRLETGIYQPEAKGLYEKYGFNEIGPFGDYEYDPMSLFMEKYL